MKALDLCYSVAGQQSAQINSPKPALHYGWAEVTLSHCGLTTHHYFRVPQFVSEFYPPPL